MLRNDICLPYSLVSQAVALRPPRPARAEDHARGDIQLLHSQLLHSQLLHSPTLHSILRRLRQHHGLLGCAGQRRRAVHIRRLREVDRVVRFNGKHLLHPLLHKILRSRDRILLLWLPLLLTRADAMDHQGSDRGRRWG